MNRDKALSIADRIMTRIETDKAIHKDAIADEIVAGVAMTLRRDDGVLVGTFFEGPGLDPLQQMLATAIRELDADLTAAGHKSIILSSEVVDRDKDTA